MQHAAAGAAHVGAQGAAHVGAGAQQLGAGAQQLGLQHLVRQHLILGILQQWLLQHLGAQQGFGAQHTGAGAQQVGAGAQQVGAGAQHVGAGAQQLALQQLERQQLLRQPPQLERQQPLPPQWKACTSVAVAAQNSRAAVKVIHFIVSVS